MSQMLHLIVSPPLQYAYHPLSHCWGQRNPWLHIEHVVKEARLPPRERLL